MNEEWRAVVGYEGNYEVSSLGRVRSLTGRDAAGRKRQGRVLKPWSVRGYDTVTLGKNTKRRVNRLVCEAFNGPPPEGKPFALHRDGDCLNNSPGNLYWGDDADNTRDKIEHGHHHQMIKTHCPQGHEYTEENTYRVPGRVGRICRICRRIKRGLEPGDPRHGTMNGYVNRGCRCDDCKKAQQDFRRLRRAN